MAISQEQLTLDEFLTLPEQEPPLEFEEGKAKPKVSPKGRHSTLQGEVYERLSRFGRPARLARAYTELRVTFAGRSVVPDVVVYTWERVPRTAEGRVADDFLIPPDIAVEIVSVGQAVNALVRRCLWYVENGVRVAVLVDPDDESILVFRRDASPLALRGTDRIDLDEVLPGFESTAQELFESLNAD